MRNPSPNTLYESVRPNIRTGDVIAFSGKGLVSDLIKLVTKSPISHVAIVMGVGMGSDGGAHDPRLMLCESTTQCSDPDAEFGEIVKGVQYHFLSQRIERYEGDVYWLKLRPPQLHAPDDGGSDGDYNVGGMCNWLASTHAERIPYDTAQAMGSGVDLFDRLGIGCSHPDFSKLFCSELVVKALQIAGAAPPTINPSECTPADVCGLGCLYPMQAIKRPPTQNQQVAA